MKGTKLNHFGLIIAFLAIAANVNAACPPLSVTSLSDSGPGSLRDAINSANACGSGQITFSGVTGTITLLSSLPCLTNITITGPGTNLLTVSGNNQYRVFCMNSGTTNALSNLTIANGLAQGTEVFTYASGISNAGSLKLLNCAVRNCTNYTSYGVGIYNAGDMDMEASVVADCGGTGYFGTALTQGGGIYNDGTLRMTNCRVSRCCAGDNGMSGGGILNQGNLRMDASLVESCWTFDQGDGSGIWNAGTAVICGCTVSNCVADFWGGAIESWGTLAMTNSTIVSNLSFQIGGGLTLGGATNWLVGCTIAGNECAGCGGGIFNYEGELRLLNCTVSGNYAYELSGGGGGLAQCPSYYGSPGTARTYLNFCTIVSNTFDAYGTAVGGGIWNGGGLFDSQNSIIADNATNDFSGLLTSEGYNLIRDTDGCTIDGDPTGNLYGQDPRLGPLQDNGGPTWTHGLCRRSPAIDAAGPVTGVSTDQRGIPRPQGLAPDIGAFEFQYTTPVVVDVAMQSGTNCSLQLLGLRGGIYILQASTNLATWVNIATLVGGTNGVCYFTETGTGACCRRFYRLLLPGPAGSVYLPAPSGIVSAPFQIADTNVFQAVDTGLTNGGRAEYPFTIAAPGDYVLQATVNAPIAGANSFFVDIDGEPQDPTMIWDIYPYTSASGFEQRTVYWRGDGTETADQFVPRAFTLAAGPHKLIIRGREMDVFLQSIILLPCLSVYLPATAGTVTAPFMVTNNYICQPIETGVTNGGRAAYTFVITNAANYVIQGLVNAPNDGANSFFVNIDAEPQDPYMIWDIPLTSGFEAREVSWRGSGTYSNNEFVPMVFALGAGSHQLIIRGREAGTQVQSFTVLQSP